MDERKPWNSRWVKANGVRTHYVEAGDGPPVVLIHGGGPGSSGEHGFSAVIPLLAPHFRVLAPDQLGFGETEKPTGLAYSEIDRVEHLSAFIDTLCLAPVRLGGNSMGAYAAARYTVDHPDEVDRLLLIGSGTLAQAMELEFRPPPWDFDGTADSLRTGLETTMLHPPPEDMVRDRVRMAQLPGAVEAQQAQRAYGARLRDDPGLRQRFLLTDRLPKLTLPIRMVWGELDRFAPVALGHQLAALLPNAELQVVPDAGHQCQHDRPDVVGASMIDFFSAGSP